VEALPGVFWTAIVGLCRDIGSGWDSMTIDWRNFIESTPGILSGRPRLKGTRIPVSLILGYLASGSNADEIISEHPDVTRDQILACLDYARHLAEFEVPIG
jgi:uncharacterized protein (DUF433 family)